ncbi:YncE family protein [Pseudomonas moraviensis]
MSDNDPINDAPQLLQELKIPGRTGPVSSTPLRWGINLAAAKLNFPRQGLLCQAGPWGTMGNRDSLRILRDSDLQIALEIVDEDAVGTELQMFVEARHLTEGMHTLSYTVTRLGGTPEPSEVMQVLVKLTLPGGPDHSEGPGHPGLVMSIPEDILKDGVHQDNVDAGVSITLGKADGSPPYPFAAAGDTPQFSWGGMFFSGPALTQEQADGETPVIVTIPKKTIVDAGDSGEAGLAVAFEVYDLVDNRSDGWSVEQRIVVTLDKTRLGAPLLKEAINNVLDVDNLGDADGTVQVMAVNPPPPSPPPVPPQPIDFEVGDTIFVRIKGTPKEGPPIDIELPGKVLISVPSIPEIIVSNAVLRQLAQAQIALSYRLEKADGSAQRDAKTQFISAIGEIHRLPAPVALEARQGAIDPLHPDLKQVTIEIAFGPYFAVGQAIKLFWLGTRPDLTPYLPNLNLRPITQGDMDAQLPLQIIVDKQHLTPIIGKELELYYQLLIEDSVLGTMSKLNQTHAIRESIHADILQIGKPRQELPEPAVDGVVSGVLPSDTNGTTLTVNYLKTVKGDIVTRVWEGSITGVNSDRVELSSITAGQPVAFPIKAELIKGNEGGTVKAYYDIKRAAGGTSYSDTLAFSVGVALDLKEPKIKQAPNDTSLDPLEAQNALTSVINYDGMLVGDKIIVRWTGAPGTPAAGSHTTEPWPVTTVGPQEIPLAVSVIAFNLAKSITLDYTVTRGTQDPKESRIRALAVLQLRVDLSHSPKIIQAADGGDGTDLDVSTLTAAATLRGGFWPHIASGQRVWMRVEGTKKDDKPYTRTVWAGPSNAVNALWISQGYLDASLPLADLQWLKDQSELAVTFMSTPDHSTDENLALSFPVRTYTVKAVEDAVLVKFTNAPYVIAPRGRLKDIEVQLSNLDGTPLQGTVTLDLPADFSFSDGGSGSRDFPSDIEGKVSVRGVTGAQTSGSYKLVASKGASVGEASATVTAQGQLTNVFIGGGTWDIAINSAGTLIYVSSWQKNNISIIDTATHEIVNTIDDIPGVHGIALSPDERLCYASNETTNTVSIIDLSSSKTIKTLTTDAGPEGVIISNNGQWLFTCNYLTNTVTQIDTRTYEIKNITVGKAPRYGAASPDGKYIYICNTQSPYISLIEIETSDVRKIDLINRAWSIAFNAIGETAYAIMDNDTAVIDARQQTVIRYIENSGGRGITTTRLGQYIYITDMESNKLARTNTATGFVGPFYIVGKVPCHLTKSTDEKKLYVCNYESDYISCIDL